MLHSKLNAHAKCLFDFSLYIVSADVFMEISDSRSFDQSKFFETHWLFHDKQQHLFEEECTHTVAKCICTNRQSLGTFFFANEKKE